jgi:hypothetical protein
LAKQGDNPANKQSNKATSRSTTNSRAANALTSHLLRNQPTSQSPTSLRGCALLPRDVLLEILPFLALCWCKNPDLNKLWTNCFRANRDWLTEKTRKAGERQAELQALANQKHDRRLTAMAMDWMRKDDRDAKERMTKMKGNPGTKVANKHAKVQGKTRVHDNTRVQVAPKVVGKKGKAIAPQMAEPL